MSHTQITGWSASQKFDSKDTSDLQKQVEDAYIKIGNLIKEKKFVEYFTLNKKCIIENSQAMYLTKEEIRNAINKNIAKWSDKSFEIEPFENYGLTFYGDNRVISIEKTDIKNKGEAALRGKYLNEDDKKRVTAIGIYLYMRTKSAGLEPL